MFKINGSDQSLAYQKILSGYSPISSPVAEGVILETTSSNSLQIDFGLLIPSLTSFNVDHDFSWLKFVQTAISLSDNTSTTLTKEQNRLVTKSVANLSSEITQLGTQTFSLLGTALSQVQITDNVANQGSDGTQTSNQSDAESTLSEEEDSTSAEETQEE